MNWLVSRIRAAPFSSRVRPRARFSNPEVAEGRASARTGRPRCGAHAAPSGAVDEPLATVVSGGLLTSTLLTLPVFDERSAERQEGAQEEAA